MINDEKRLAIMAELARRAEQGGIEAKYYQKLGPVIAMLLGEAGLDAVELMGLYHALVRYGAMVAYGTIGSPADLQVRTANDMAGTAGALWDKACRDAEELVAKIQSLGKEVPKELIDKTKAAPSDPSKRPDIAPKAPMVEPERPENLQDLLGRINSMGSRSN